MRVLHKTSRGQTTYIRHKKFKIKLTLGTYILLSLILGLIFGYFFPQYTHSLSNLGNICIQFLQMGVLPFIVVSLICGLGAIKAQSLLRLLVSFGLTSIILWVLFFILAVALYYTFPTIEQHSLYTFSHGHTAPLSEIFIPTNPFKAMSSDTVPAVVVFFTCLGIAIINVKNKKPLLDSMNVFLMALLKLNSFMVNLVPVIVFSFTANMIGGHTLTISKLLEFQVFLVSSILGCIITFFFILPLLVVTFTEIKYWEFMHEFKSIVITAFLTSNTIIMIPMIIEKIEEMSKKHKIEGESNTSVIHTSISVGFNITGPSMIPTVIFIFFSAWFIGEGVSGQFASIFLYAVSTLFGGQTFSLIMLLEYLHLPADMIGIYYMFSNLYLQNTIAAVKQPFLGVLAIICVFANAGRISFRLFSFLKLAIIGVVITAGLLFGLGAYYRTTVSGDKNSYDSIIDKMELISPVPVKVETEAPKDVVSSHFNTLKELVDKKEIRVCYRKNLEPFTFLNSKGQVLGLVSELTERLAASLGCSITYIPADAGDEMMLLKTGAVDLGFYEFNIDNIQDLLDIGYTDPILFLQSGLIVKNQDKDKFTSWDSIINNPDITIGISLLYPMNSILQEQIKKANKAKILKFPDYIGDEPQLMDHKVSAVFSSQERGIFFCLQNPRFSFVMPDGLSSINENSLIYITNKDNIGFIYYINYWLKIMQQTKEIEKLYAYWVQGKLDSR